jgi:hypothetical protein
MRFDSRNIGRKELRPYVALFCCAFCLAHRARCAAAIFLRAARLILRPGLAALARFIFPCAQRCFSSRDSFLRAAALMRLRRRFLGTETAAAALRSLRAPVDLIPAIAEIALSS